MSTSIPARTGGGTGLLALAGVLWGTGGLAGSLLERHAGLAPIAVATYRLALGGLLVAVVLAATGRRLPRGSAAWRRIGAVAVLAAVFQGTYFAAVSLTSVGLATLVTIGTAPVVVIVAEAVRGRGQRGAATTVTIALAGLILLAGLPGERGEPVTVLVGAALGAVAGSGFATMTLLAARPVDGLDDATTTAAAFVLGGVLLAPLAGPGLFFTPTATAVTLLLALALVPTALAYTAYFRGLRRASAPTVGAVLALLEPLTAATLAAVLLDERLGAAGITGAALLAVAVLRASGRDGAG